MEGGFHQALCAVHAVRWGWVCRICSRPSPPHHLPEALSAMTPVPRPSRADSQRSRICGPEPPPRRATTVLGGCAAPVRLRLHAYSRCCAPWCPRWGSRRPGRSLGPRSSITRWFVSTQGARRDAPARQPHVELECPQPEALHTSHTRKDASPLGVRRRTAAPTSSAVHSWRAWMFTLLMGVDVHAASAMMEGMSSA